MNTAEHGPDGLLSTPAGTIVIERHGRGDSFAQVVKWEAKFVDRVSEV